MCRPLTVSSARQTGELEALCHRYADAQRASIAANSKEGREGEFDRRREELDTLAKRFDATMAREVAAFQASRAREFKSIVNSLLRIEAATAADMSLQWCDYARAACLIECDFCVLSRTHVYNRLEE